MFLNSFELWNSTISSNMLGFSKPPFSQSLCFSDLFFGCFKGWNFLVFQLWPSDERPWGEQVTPPIKKRNPSYLSCFVTNKNNGYSHFWYVFNGELIKTSTQLRWPPKDVYFGWGNWQKTTQFSKWGSQRKPPWTELFGGITIILSINSLGFWGSSGLLVACFPVCCWRWIII